MTEETQVPTEPETQNQPASEAPQPEVAQQDSTAPEGQEAEEAKAEGEDKPDKTPEQKELERLKRQLTKAHRANGKLSLERQQALEQLQRFAPQQEYATDLSHLAPEQIQALIDQEADRRAAAKVKTQTVQTTIKQSVEAGYAAFGREAFDAATEVFVDEVGGFKDEHGRINPVVDAVLRIPDAHAVIKYLGENAELASELPGLDPFELGLKLADIRQRMANKPQPKPVSKAPQPVKPLGASRGQPALENLSMDEYIAARKAQGARWAR